ncbi:DH domain-containing protein [Entamoeba marina]
MLIKYLGDSYKESTKLLEEMASLSSEISEMLSSKRETAIKELYEAVGKMDIYADYFVFYEKHSKELEDLKKHVEFDRLKEAIPQLRRLDAMDFLIKPIQRITKYPLFIKEAKPLFVDLLSLEYLPVLEKRVEETLKKQNEKQRQYLSNRMIQSLIPRLVWKKYGEEVDLLKTESTIVLSQEEIEIEGVKNKKRRDLNALYTFTNFIMIGKIGLRGKVNVFDIVSFNDIELVNSRNKVGDVQLNCTNNRCYMIDFHSSTEKLVWVSKFNELRKKLKTQPKKTTQMLSRSTQQTNTQNTDDVFDILHSISNPSLSTNKQTNSTGHHSRQSIL